MKKNKPKAQTRKTGIISKLDYQPFLRGPNIFLREVRGADVNESYYEWLNDPEVTQFTEAHFYPQSLKSIEDYVSKQSNYLVSNSVFLAICLNSTGEHIGNIKVGPINWYHRFADLSIIVGKKTAWGFGYGTEAIKLVTAYAFNNLNLHRLNAYIYSNNTGSQNAFTKAGFTEEGMCRKKRFFNGSYIDEKTYGIVNE